MLQSRLKVLILQHPQEPDKELGTARLVQTLLPESATLRVGLSWPNLKKATGDAAAVPSEWAVLYLGAGRFEPSTEDRLLFLDKKGKPRPDAGVPPQLKGVILLDGTWSQAKTLWWRNAWLLKLHRCALVPAAPSLYGKKRKEPRRECLSTVESVALTLDLLGEAPEIRAGLIQAFREHLAKF